MGNFCSVYDVCGVDKILAGEAGDVGAGAAEPPALNDSGAVVQLGGDGPGDKFSCFTAAEDKEVVVVWI